VKDRAGRIELPRGGAVLSAKGPTTLELGRFADQASIPLPPLTRGKPAALRIPADSAPDPWYLSSTGAGLEICALQQNAKG